MLYSVTSYRPPWITRLVWSASDAEQWLRRYPHAVLQELRPDGTWHRLQDGTLIQADSPPDSLAFNMKGQDHAYEAQASSCSEFGHGRQPIASP